MTLRHVLPMSLMAAALALCLASASSVSADDATKGSVSGKVVAATGTDVVKTGTVLVLKPEDVPTSQAGGGRGAASQLAAKAVAKGDVADGAYKIADVPVGKYTIMVNAMQAGRGKAEGVEVTAGKETAVPDIKLAARGGGRRGGGGGGAGGGAGGAAPGN